MAKMDLFPELHNLSSAFSCWNVCSSAGTGCGWAGCVSVPSLALGQQILQRLIGIWARRLWSYLCLLLFNFHKLMGDDAHVLRSELI